MALSQAERLIRITTVLGEDTFVALSFSGTEKISDLFNFTVELVSEKNDITFDQLAGTKATVGLHSTGDTPRYFNGIITAFSPEKIAKDDGYSKYSAAIKPSFWMLKQCSDCRIFQDKSIPDIIEQVLGSSSLNEKGVSVEVDFRLELTNSYEMVEYCVQYNESDFDFVSRLCEQEGIYYFFEHIDGNHTLVLADSPDGHKPHGGQAIVPLEQTPGAEKTRDVVNEFEPHQKLTTGKYTSRDYHFVTPDTDMTVTRETQHTSPKGQGEKYEYPGGYETSSGRGENLAKIRMEASDSRIYILKGRSRCRHFTSGYTFKLSGHTVTALNATPYVFTKVRHEARQGLPTGRGSGADYFNIFLCIPHEVPFRPLRLTDRPRMTSSQTAIVTGPQSEEIHTDKHGRIKVKFFWDRRPDKGDGNMSCWIRVSQIWAANNWGSMFIPRVGQEVIVNFLDGDPDRPIVTGCVYHGKNMPPYDVLTDGKTKSTIKSNSTIGGGNANEICFDDNKGEEEFYTHAAKDQKQVVENDMTTEINAGQVVKVEKDRSLTISSGNETIAIENGSRNMSVKSNEEHINSADFTRNVSGNFTLKVNGNITIDASGTVKISGAKVILNG